MKRSDENISIVAEKWGQFLRKNKLKCAIAESCTGGGIAFALTAIPGSSTWFERGFVTYSNLAKQELLGIPENIIQTYGAVSKETAEKMAEGALHKSPVDIALSVTGVAGPDGGTKEKPVGTVWFGFAGKNTQTQTIHHFFSGDRQTIRCNAIIFALQWSLSILLEKL